MRPSPGTGWGAGAVVEGNSQVPKGDRDAPVQAYIWAIPGWKRNLGHRLDDLIVRTVPDVRKAVRWVALARGRGTTARTAAIRLVNPLQRDRPVENSQYST